MHSLNGFLMYVCVGGIFTHALILCVCVCVCVCGRCPGSLKIHIRLVAGWTAVHCVWLSITDGHTQTHTHMHTHAHTHTHTHTRTHTRACTHTLNYLCT